MIYGSVCSGIEGATVAWHPLGWRAAWYAEVDPFCSALFKHHYPETPNYGDFTTLSLSLRTRPDRNGAPARDSLCTDDHHGQFAARRDVCVAQPIDLLVGGTPCQSFSVAGKREGLDDPRGNLTLEFLALAGRLRPRWVVWENVPGVLSIDHGRTFGTFLGLLGQLGYGFAYRVLDAQYFGVPQRRRRVFVVGHLGDWRRVAAVLFERASLSGHPAPSRETGQDIARCVATGTNSQRYDWETENFVTAPALCASGRGVERTGESRGQDPVIVHSLRADGFDASEDGTGRGTPSVFDYKQSGEIDPTMRSLGHDKSHANGGGHLAVAINLRGRDGGAMPQLSESASVRSSSGGSSRSYVQSSGVRRLTPRECERLQGFPDIRQNVTIRICSSDHLKRLARAEIVNLKLQKSASPVGESALTSSVQFADIPLNGSPPRAPRRAVVNVAIDCEVGTLEIRSHEKLILSVKIADEQGRFLPPTQFVDFARLTVATLSWSVQITQAGAAAVRQNNSDSLLHANGRVYALVSGRELAEGVSGVEGNIRRAKDSLKFTTSELGLNSQNSDWNLATLPCSVAIAIASYIPDEIKHASFYDLELSSVRGYTAIPYRGKPAADGPRYRALGNSFAVPVVRWIGERIEMVENLQTSAA